ncbi:MAG: peptidoglycan-binding protein [Lachnospiraceae bacterium]|nr:peptidoglycan-binding protein [Lachnospiraceae bacterium]
MEQISIIQQNNESSFGLLKVHVLSAFSQRPVADAHIQVFPEKDSGSTLTGNDSRNAAAENHFTGVLAEVSTDISGQTESLRLPAPPVSYSLEPGEPRPYARYQLMVTAEGYEPLTIDGLEILAETESLQTVALRPLDSTHYPFDPIIITDNTLYGDFPAKISESETKELAEGGEIVLSRVVVPETIVVHDGVPSDRTAQDFFVPYRDYIKNVACSEIYATWNPAAIRANVLVILSFTLNRVYTEWYRNKGYDFTITSSTAYDQKWTYGQNIFQSISDIVDELFTAYLSRPNVKQPILTQYCDGRRVSCPNWLSQWGSQSLAESGYSAIQILRYYYGESLYINTAEEISGIPYSWPGSDLTVGSTGQKVMQLQEQLNTIAGAYPAIPTITVDGIYGSATQNAVRTFQSVFGLPATGVTDYSTWFKISQIFVGVSGIAELV